MRQFLKRDECSARVIRFHQIIHETEIKDRVMLITSWEGKRISEAHCFTYTKSNRPLSVTSTGTPKSRKPFFPSFCTVMEVNSTTNTNKHHHLRSHNHPHAHFPSKTILIIIASFASVMVVLIVIVVIIFMLRRLKLSGRSTTHKDNRNSRVLHHSTCRAMALATFNFDSSPDVKGGCLSGGNMSMSMSRAGASKLRGVQVFTYRELQEATDGFSEANLIENGGFGLMYRGVLSDGTLAAIKLLRREGKQGERSFRLEVDLLSRLQSPYLVELLGYCADQHHRLLIFEFMPNGTLHHHLHSAMARVKPLDWCTRMRIALDCARALEFLHEHVVPPVIHRDFKCTTVLLDHNLRAKVSDLGLAKMGSERINGQISTRVLGTTGYLAPEYACSGKLTTKSDVYSYGVVLLELLTGRVPVDIKRPPGEHVLVSWALPRLTNREKLEEMVDPALRGHYSKKDLIQIGAIAAMCIQPEADYRPLMTDVVQSLIPLVRNPCVGSFSSPRFQKQTSGPIH